MQSLAASTVRPSAPRIAAPRRGALRCVAAASWAGNKSCHNGAHLTKERKAELEKVAEHIAQRGKGITACDEGPGTIGDRFAKARRESGCRSHAMCRPGADVASDAQVGIANSEEARRSYRQMLFEAEGASAW